MSGEPGGDEEARDGIDRGDHRNPVRRDINRAAPGIGDAHGVHNGIGLNKVLPRLGQTVLRGRRIENADLFERRSLIRFPGTRGQALLGSRRAESATARPCGAAAKSGTIPFFATLPIRTSDRLFGLAWIACQIAPIPNPPQTKVLSSRSRPSPDSCSTSISGDVSPTALLPGSRPHIGTTPTNGFPFPRGSPYNGLERDALPGYSAD